LVYFVVEFAGTAEEEIRMGHRSIAHRYAPTHSLPVEGRVGLPAVGREGG